jgi:hypothetical protein
LRRAEEIEMRDNSGSGESSNNNRDPTLRDHERARGRSGEAVHGGKQEDATADRTSARKHGADSG